ncbi:MAG: HAMP domain-containing protein [Verrucomicrobia bacterium]|nr:HAMP domain-containing protein [Verrucomicrobiota bacterium]
MDTRRTRFGQRMGIGLKIALLAWSVTLVTLLIFVAAIIPEQKHIFIENLDSKGRGIAVSLQDVAAGALVTEDYSTVVDHCLQLLKGDPTLSYLVLVRMDGYALTIDPSGWHDDQLDGTWRPAERRERSGIETRPLFRKRVFHYASPLNYSGGIEWGWIHIGLSLDSYERSVAKVYARTAVLAMICVLVSAAVSAGYARRLVRPIGSLQEVVRAVARGQLSARADIRSGDEIESLAHSFNGMTAGLQHRNRILESVRFAAQTLLSTDDWRTVIDEVLAKLGQSASVGSAYIFENHIAPDGALLCSQRYEWIAPGGAASLPPSTWQNLRWHGAGLDSWVEIFQQGEFASAHVRELGEAERAVIDPQVKSLMLMPILVRGVWWGLIGFDQWNQEREWNDAERDSLKAAADMLGAAIERKRTQDALLEAKQTLEQRVQERTRELQEQMSAKARAHAALAEAQQSLVEVSRRAGMAEVATSVLHNVGNVLNSVNVSITLVHHRLRRSGLRDLEEALAILRAHESDLPRFLTSDPRGQSFLNFLSQLTEHLATENGWVRDEVKSIMRHVEHIKEIVAMQQSYAQVSGVREMLSVSQLMEDALHINATAFQRHGVELERDYETVPALLLERHKILQILVNLLRNAKEALIEGRKEKRIVRLRIARHSDQWLRISISDNGIGIAPENRRAFFSTASRHERRGTDLACTVEPLPQRKWEEA